MFFPQQIESSPFLGIGEGKRKARIEEEKRKTMQLETDLAIARLNAGVKSDDMIAKEAEENSSDSMKQIIGIVAALVVIVVVIVFVIK